MVGGKEIPGSRGEIGAYIAKVIPGGAAEQTGKFVEGRCAGGGESDCLLWVTTFWKAMRTFKTSCKRISVASAIEVSHSIFLYSF